MEKTKKVTKRERYETLLTFAEVKADVGMVEFINHELELLARKNVSGEKKLTTLQIENNSLKNTILEVLKKAQNSLTITDIIKAHEDLKELSNQKVSQLARQLVLAELITKEKSGNKTLFSIAKVGE